MDEVSYIVDTTLQPQDCFGIRILMSNLRSPLMKVISTPLAGVFVIWGLCRQGFCHAFIQDAMYFSVVFTVFLFTSLI